MISLSTEKILIISFFFTVEAINKTVNLHKEIKPIKIEENKKMAEPEPLPSLPQEGGQKPSGALTLSVSNSKLSIVKKLCLHGFISIILYKIKLL